MKYLSILMLASILILAGCSGDDPVAPLATPNDQVAIPATSEVVPVSPDNAWGGQEQSNGMVPFRGTYTTVVSEAGFIPPSTVQLDIWGEGSATYLGQSTWYSLSSVDINTGEQWGSTAEVASNGDELHYDYLGGSGVDPDTGLTFFSGEWTVTGGTGRFANATGGGTYEGTADGTQGTGQITLIGQISRPNSYRFGSE